MCDAKCVCSWTHTIGLLMCFLRGISSLSSDTALTDAEFALTDAEFLAKLRCGLQRRCMAAQPCTKCGENPRGGILSPYASLWRACPDDDELCDWCRDDIEWTKAFFSEPLSEQLMFAASFGDLRRVGILINQGASLSCAHSGIGTSTSAPAPAPAGDGKQCMFRLTAAAAALLEFDEGQFDDVMSVTAGNWLSQHGGRSATGGETVLPRQNRLFPVWCLPCAVKLSTRVAGKHPHSQGSVASSSARRRAPSAPRGGGRVFLGL